MTKPLITQRQIISGLLSEKNKERWNPPSQPSASLCLVSVPRAMALSVAMTRVYCAEAAAATTRGAHADTPPTKKCSAVTRYQAAPAARAVRGIEPLVGRLAPLRAELQAHPFYGALDEGGMRGLRAFMEVHVFAVLDFMSLVKALQRLTTCVTVPWVPPLDTELSRLVNQLVLDEESDVTPEEGLHSSHFELYVRAMRQAGADTGPALRFVDALRAGVSVRDALASSGAPPAAARFVESTMAVAQAGNLHEIAAAFTFGREDVIPIMFQAIVDRIENKTEHDLSHMRYYLQRHIEMDGDDHGPLAMRMVERVCGDSDAKWAAAGRAAEGALSARLALWDGATQAIEKATTTEPRTPLRRTASAPASLSPPQSPRARTIKRVRANAR